MRTHRAGLGVAASMFLALAAAVCPAAGREAGSSEATAGAAGGSSEWEHSASLYGYLIPDGSDYLVPMLSSDKGRLHLEGRYNYEAAKTGSIFGGWNFSAGETCLFEATAMAAVIFGDVRGAAPAYRMTLEYKRLDLYTEGEYVFDSEGSEGDFFYAWTEVSYRPVDWFRVGAVGQRTRLYETGLDIQRGILLGFTKGPMDFTGYVFNFDLDNPTGVLAATISY